MNDRLRAAIQEERDGAAAKVRYELAAKITVGPLNGGYALFLGTFPLGKWSTREEACDAGILLGEAIRLGKI
jgi:hypothetical protein